MPIAREHSRSVARPVAASALLISRPRSSGMHDPRSAMSASAPLCNAEPREVVVPSALRPGSKPAGRERFDERVHRNEVARRTCERQARAPVATSPGAVVELAALRRGRGRGRRGRAYLGWRARQNATARLSAVAQGDRCQPDCGRVAVVGPRAQRTRPRDWGTRRCIGGRPAAAQTAPKLMSAAAKRVRHGQVR